MPFISAAHYIASIYINNIVNFLWFCKVFSGFTCTAFIRQCSHFACVLPTTSNTSLLKWMGWEWEKSCECYALIQNVHDRGFTLLQIQSNASIHHGCKTISFSLHFTYKIQNNRKTAHWKSLSTPHSKQHFKGFNQTILCIHTRENVSRNLDLIFIYHMHSEQRFHQIY